MAEQLVVAIRGDATDFKKALAEAGAEVNRFSGAMDRAGASSTTMAAGLAVVGAGLAAFAGVAIKGASDVAESMSKVNTVFGESSAKIQEFASTTATQFGLARGEALDTLGAFGNMFTQLGIGVGAAADMSIAMTGLAADFSSFHNADITDVLVAQTAAFRGEYDALQRFVPVINAAAVQQKAMAMTGKDNEKSLTAQEKALATYRLILDGAGAATGDFKRTSEGFANSTRRLTAQFKDISDEIGGKLLPLITPLVSAFADKLPAAWAQAKAAADLLFDPKYQVVIISLAGALTGVLVPALYAAGAAALAALSGWIIPLLPFLAVGALVGAMLGIMVTDFNGARTAIIQAASIITAYVVKAFTDMATTVPRLIAGMAAAGLENFAALGRGIANILEQLPGVGEGIAGALRSAADGAVSWAAAASSASDAMGAAGQAAFDSIITFGNDAIATTNEWSSAAGNAFKGVADAMNSATAAMTGTGAGAGAGAGVVPALNETAKAAGAAKTALQELGISADLLRKIGDALAWSQAQVDAGILKLGGDILDTGEMVEGLNISLIRLAATFRALGADAAQAMALAVQVRDIERGKIAAAEAKAEADRLAAEAERLNAASAGRLQSAMEAAKFSVDEMRRVLGPLGVDLVDVGDKLGNTGQTAARLAADFERAGLSADEAAAAVQRLGAEAARLAAEEARMKAAEEAIAGIAGVQTQNMLGFIRGRAIVNTVGAASDLAAAVAGLEKLKAAGLDTTGALDLLNERLFWLSSRFAGLGGDDLASAGVVTDAIRALQGQLAAGEINVTEFTKAVSTLIPEMDRLAGVVQSMDEAFAKFEEDAAKQRAVDTAERAREIASGAVAAFQQGLQEKFDEERWQDFFFGGSIAHITEKARQAAAHIATAASRAAVEAARRERERANLQNMQASFAGTSVRAQLHGLGMIPIMGEDVQQSIESQIAARRAGMDPAALATLDRLARLLDGGLSVEMDGRAVGRLVSNDVQTRAALLGQTGGGF